MKTPQEKLQIIINILTHMKGKQNEELITSKNVVVSVQPPAPIFQNNPKSISSLENVA